MANRYSVYERGTDRPIMIHGTSAECAGALRIGIPSFYKQIQRSRQGQPSQKYEIFTDEEDPDGQTDDQKILGL